MFVITAEQPGAVGKEASWLASERTEQRSQPATRGTYGVHCCRPLTAATSRKACRPPAANIQSSAACQSTRTPFCFEDSYGDQRPYRNNIFKIDKW